MTDAAAVRTPQTQCQGTAPLVPKRELKALMRRSNAPGLIRLVFWVALVLATGALVWLAMGSFWVLPAMVLHGIVLVHHFSLLHECTHFTAFKQRWLNNLVATLCGLVIVLPPRFFRYEHTDHHTYTHERGKDPELIELPKSLWGYLSYLSAVPYWKIQVVSMARKFAGWLTEEEKRFTPEIERPRVIRDVRLMVAFYAAVGAAMLAFGWAAPLWYWVLPVLLGEPFMRAIRMTEHVGRPHVNDMTQNTRTNLVSAPMRFLCWNMNYHAEHHYAPSVPFHALPKLHALIRDHVHVEAGGYLPAHKDILAQILGRKPRVDLPAQAAG